MNERQPVDEDDFAKRLEQVELAAWKNEPKETNIRAVDDPDQREQLLAAARVIGMIHRVRKSKSGPSGEADIRETLADKLDTSRHQQIDDAMPDAAIDPETTLLGGTIPDKLGRFQIKRKLGQGGFGLIFLAIDPQLDREVALKVPRAEALVDSAVRARFLREAKAAGGLNHANIVPVFESGHIGPVCYIASAFCHGPSLGEWVLDHDQPVSPMVAAELLLTLADAVQHAHSRGIIHRDLKPDNVLVELEPNSQNRDQASRSTAAPLLRITDFGLARDLDDQSKLTQSGAVLGTPCFMSPEQTDSGFGEPGLGSDIYGLGAILYFLLCKVPPIGGSSLLDTIHKVQEQAPVPPGKIRPEIPRDLEAICLKCLEKQSRHRYQTASELQSDLLRFRDGLPVQARRPSTLDRALMWCRRRPAVSALAASLFVVLAISSVALGILLARSNSLKIISDANATLATESASLAIVERDRTRDALHAMTSDVAANWLGSRRELTTEQKAFLEHTVAFYQSFAAGNTDDPEEQFWVAQAEHRLAQLFSRLGQFDLALESADRAIELLEQIPAEWEPAEVGLELVDSLHDKDATLTQMGKIPDALPVAERAVEISRELFSANPEDIRAQNLLGEVTGNLGSRYQQLRRFDDALVAKTESVLIGEQLCVEQPLDTGAKRSLGIKSMNLGILLVNMRRLADARSRFDQSLEIREELAQSEPESAVYQFDLAFVIYNMAGLEIRSNNLEAAQTLAERSTQISPRLVEQNPMVEQYRRHLAASLGNQSAILNVGRRFEESETVLAELDSVVTRSVEDFPDVPAYLIFGANGKSSLATTLAEQGRYEEAIQNYDSVINLVQEMSEQSIEVSRARQMLEIALSGRATALGYVDRDDDAIADWDALLDVTHPLGKNTVWLCLATSLVKLGDIETALSEVDRVLAETMEQPEDQRDFRIFYNSACVYSLTSARTDKENESREYALRAIALLQQAVDAGLPTLANVRADPELEPLHAYAEYQALVQE